MGQVYKEMYELQKQQSEELQRAFEFESKLVSLLRRQLALLEQENKDLNVDVGTLEKVLDGIIKAKMG